MKKLLPLILCAIFVSDGCVKEKTGEFTLLGEYQYPPYNAYPEKINGKVRKLVEKSYWAVPEGTTFRKGEPISRKEKDSLGLKNNILATFDTDGTLVTDYLTDENNRPFFMLDFEKKDGRLEKMKATLDGNEVAYQTFQYDDKGNLAGYMSFRPGSDSLLNYMTVLYSPDKLKVTHLWFNSRNEATARHIYSYDASGIFLGRDSYNGQDEFMASVGIKNNEMGKVSELIISDKSHNPVYIRNLTYEYDKRGNWIKAVAVDSKGQAVFQERDYTYYK